MGNPIELRIGICGCTGLYHGQLDGKRMRIDGRSYVVKEIPLPDEQFHTTSLKQHRCHLQ